MIKNYPLCEATTSNGIRVIVNPDPWVSGVVTHLTYNVGSAEETPGRTGLAHLFEHLMFSGSRQVANGEHLSSVQALGGDANASTSFDRTAYYDAVPAGGLDMILWMEADRLATLLETLDQRNLDTQRMVVYEEKDLRYDNAPYGDAFTHLMTLVFPEGHHYHHLPIGLEEDLAGATLGDVHGFFLTHYRPTNLTICISGAVDPSQAFALVDKHFSSITTPASAPVSVPTYATLPALTSTPRLDIRSAVPQDAIYIAWRTPPDTVGIGDAIGLGLSVMADGLTAHLHHRLVIPGLADSVDAFDLGLVRGNSAAGIVATCTQGTPPERLEHELLAAWDDFITTGPTDAEHARAIIADEREWLADLASIQGRASAIADAVATHGDPDRINAHLDTIRAITPDDVRLAFTTHLSGPSAAIVTYRSAS